VTPQPTFTFPVSFRQVDRPIFDALVSIAQKEGRSASNIFRTALTEYAESKTRSDSAGRKLDEFFDKSVMSAPVYHEILTPAELRRWTEGDLFHAAKLVRGRKDEIDHELRRRGYVFRW
jgi:hypothetical protein